MNTNWESLANSADVKLLVSLITRSVIRGFVSCFGISSTTETGGLFIFFFDLRFDIESITESPIARLATAIPPSIRFSSFIAIKSTLHVADTCTRLTHDRMVISLDHQLRHLFAWLFDDSFPGFSSF